ncbi:Uncharacterized protein HZ326_11650 [Fusarium oxysporum f. sp. albedinis]|nr:Uncharacterized protein HZ326_11650 [Fusarium oxysporum f. sp. albedinis]
MDDASCPSYTSSLIPPGSGSATLSLLLQIYQLINFQAHPPLSESRSSYPFLHIQGLNQLRHFPLQKTNNRFTLYASVSAGISPRDPVYSIVHITIP